MGDQIKVELFHSVEMLISNKAKWDEAVGMVNGEIYYYSDWLLTWMKHYGQNSDIRCFIFSRDKKTIGVLPFLLRHAGVPGIRARIAQLIGSHSSIVVFRLPILEGLERLAICHAVDYLLNEASCDCVVMSSLDLDKVDLDLASLDSSKNILTLEETGICTRFELAESFDAYLAKFNRKRRQKTRYERKQIEASLNLELQVFEDEKCLSVFDEFVTLHTAQWEAQGQKGHFGEWAKSIEFNKDLIRGFSNSKKVRMYRLQSDEETVSMSFSFQTSTVSHNRLTARVIDSKYEKLGIGKMAYVYVLEKLMDDGVFEEETGPGHYDYKVSLGASEYPLFRMSFMKKRPLAKLRANTTICYFNLLNFLYYRVWFLKLSKKLKFGPGSLWTYWSRNRI